MSREEIVPRYDPETMKKELAQSLTEMSITDLFIKAAFKVKSWSSVDPVSRERWDELANHAWRYVNGDRS